MYYKLVIVMHLTGIGKVIINHVPEECRTYTEQRTLFWPTHVLHLRTKSGDVSTTSSKLLLSLHIFMLTCEVKRILFAIFRGDYACDCQIFFHLDVYRNIFGLFSHNEIN